MERLFSTCTRLYDLVESQGRLEEPRGYHPEVFQELNLDVSTEELLSSERAFTYADLCAMLASRTTLVWLTPHTAVTLGAETEVVYCWRRLNGSCHFGFSVDGKYIFAFARSPEHVLEICDVVLRWLAVSVVRSVRLYNWSSPGLFINAPTLAYLMEQCQSLKTLILNNLKMDENHFRVLSGYSRPGLEIVLDCCKITSAGASALVEVLGRNQGPTKLTLCEIDNFVLAEGLRGNSRLKSLRPCFSSNLEVRDREFLAIAGALEENKGRVDLYLTNGLRGSDETWGAICDSLGTHPTLEVLDVRGTLATTAPPEVFKSRIQAILNMAKTNLSIHTIHLHAAYSEHELFRGSVVPYLETNRLRPRLLAIQRTRPIPYRAKVLGRALLSVRTDPNHFWMLLSGNAEVALPSTAATIAAAANLPTPATAVATSTSTANVAGFAGPVTTTGTGSLPIAAAAAATDAATSADTPSTAFASDAFPCAPTSATTAANVATPSASQKRQSRP
jgi:hypothetical protein